MAFISKKSGDYEKVIPVVLEEFVNGVPKKTIANNHKIDIAIVVSILNSNKSTLNKMRENKRKENIVMMSKDVIVHEEPVDYSSKTKGRKTRAVITSEIKKEIIELCKDNDTSYADIASAYNVALSTVSRFAREAGIMRKSGKSDKKEVENYDIKNVNSNYKMDNISYDSEEHNQPFKSKEESEKMIDAVFNSIINTTDSVTNIDGFNYNIKKIEKPSNIYEIGLVDERHDLPVDNCIYRSLDDNEIFDYNELYRIAKKHIEENAPDNSVIVLYCTGLQSALGAVIKACFSLNRSLILKHYSNQTKNYTNQEIFNFNNVLMEECEYPFNNLEKYSTVYSYECSLGDLIANHDVYMVNYFSSSKNDRENIEKHNIFCTRYEDAFKLFGELSMNIQDINKDISVFVRKATVNKSSCIVGQVISKTYNYYENSKNS